MKRLFFLFFIITFSLELVYGGLVIGRIKNVPITEDDSQVSVLHDSVYQLSYPSRVIDIKKIEDKYIVYNLHIAGSDFLSAAKIKLLKCGFRKNSSSLLAI